MTNRLTPPTDGLAKVGKSKTPRHLAARMPSVDLAAKVGAVGIGYTNARRVTRRNAVA